MLGGLVVVIVITTVTDALLHVSGIFPPLGQAMVDSLFLLALVYRTIYGVGGGYTTARLAPHSPIKHALVLGVIGLLLGVAGTVATWNRGPEFGPKWYALTVAGIAIPSAYLGSKLVRKS